MEIRRKIRRKYYRVHKSFKFAIFARVDKKIGTDCKSFNSQFLRLIASGYELKIQI